MSARLGKQRPGVQRRKSRSKAPGFVLINLTTWPFDLNRQAVLVSTSTFFYETITNKNLTNPDD